MNRYFSAAAVITVVLPCAGAAWVVAAWELKKTATETALLETENSAARVMAAMQQPAIWSDKIVPSKNPPPATLWGLERWPQGGEVFFVMKGSDSFLVRKEFPARDNSAGNERNEGATGNEEEILEFAPFAAQEMFKRTMGSAKNVEWLLANSANRSETSLATIESGEATQTNSEPNAYFALGTQISAAVAVPGTNTILRQFFGLSYRDVFVSPVFGSVFAASAFAITVALMIAKFRSGVPPLEPPQDNTAPHGATTNHDGTSLRSELAGFDEFLARVQTCSQSEFIKNQCIILISPDHLATKSVQKRTSIVGVMAEELARAGIHGPIATRLESKTAGNTNASSTNDVSPLLFALYCPHFDATKALAFAEYCRTRLNSRPEMAFGAPQTTFSAAVVEFAIAKVPNLAEPPVVSHQFIADLFASAALTLHRIQENGGNATGLAGEAASDSRRCS